MAEKIKYEVERLDPHGEDPGGKMKECIEAGAAKGWTLVAVIPFFSENQVVWQLPTREQRG